MLQLVQLALFILAIYGLANAIAVLKIGQAVFGTHKQRKFLGRIPFMGDLFYCPPCLAFWIGIAFSKWVFSPSKPFVDASWKSLVVDGLAASGVVWLIHLMASWLGRGDPEL